MAADPYVAAHRGIWPSTFALAIRKYKLRARYRGRYQEELTRTLEKASLLQEIINDG